MKRPILAAAALVVTVSTAMAADRGGPPYRLHGVKYIEEFSGSEASRQLLARQGFVVTDQQFLQIFQAYISLDRHLGQIPKFITVDSAWHTYHVLLEDGVRSLEESQAAVLRRFSRRLCQVASRQNDTVGRDLAAFAAVGAALEDPAWLESLPDAQKTVVQPVLSMIDQGGAPKWNVLFFELPLTPEQFRPVSFYTSSEKLRRYFAARQWYATRAFRLKSDVETIRAMALVRLIETDEQLAELYQKLTEPYDALLGPPDDAGVKEYAGVLRKVGGGLPSPEAIPSRLGAFRREAARLPAPQVNDQWLLPEEYARRAEETRGMRLLPSRRLPSAVLFQRTVDPEVKGRMFPSGVDLFAVGPLACEAGKRALQKQTTDGPTVDAIMHAEAAPLPDSLHGKALELLTLLQRPVPGPATPALHRPAWHDKQLFTALGAWAEQRHTWALHAKITMHAGGITEEPPGYVSPYPEFFRGLAQLARQTADALNRSTPEGPDLQAAGQELLDMLAEFSAPQPEQGRTITMEQIARENRVSHLVSECLSTMGKSLGASTEADWSKAWDELKRSAQRCVEGKGVTENDRWLMTAFTQAPEGEARDLLPEFAVLCDRLAEIAQKQLDGQKLDEQDAELIRHYGMKLARFHFYGSNSWLAPRDDFPLAVPIFISPYGNLNQILYAGVARPEAIWVIVEVDGQPVLHRGAVLSYREFRRPVDQTVTDESWLGEIRGGLLPPPPAFTASFRQEITEEEALAMLRAGKIYAGVATLPGRAVTKAMAEALCAGTAEKPDWFRELLCKRATDEDLPDLLAVLQKTPLEEVGDVAYAIARLNWQPYRQKLMDLLRHIHYADAAAYILSQDPQAIDVAALADTYQAQPPRTRRLYCYLIGQSRRLGKRGREVLLAALSDQDPGVRYQAAAVASLGQVGPEIVEKLIAGIDDPNEYTAAAMVHASVKLGVKDAAATMLARLQKGTLPRARETLKKRAQRDAAAYSGWMIFMVQRCCEPPHSDIGREIKTLPEELIAGLAELDYQPAEAYLRTFLRPTQQMIKHRDFGAEALDALIRLEPEGKRRLLLEVVADKKADGRTICRALKRIAESKDLDYVDAILPLLDDPARSHQDYAATVCGDAAKTLADMLADVDRHDAEAAAVKEKVRARLRQVLKTPAGPDALDAIYRIEGGDPAALALPVALDKSLPGKSRVAALETIGNVFQSTYNPLHVKALLPLLEDDSSAEGHFFYGTIAEAAAATIGDLCRFAVAELPGHAEAVRLGKTHLRKMLRGPYGWAALDALSKIDEDQRLPLLVKAALDRSLPYDTRMYALESMEFEVVQSVDLVKDLLPLLDDGTRPPDRDDELSIAECAANGIAALLGREERIDEYDEPEEKAGKLKQIRTWAEAAAKRRNP